MAEKIFIRCKLNFMGKLFSLDFFLIFLILLLGLISFFAMYSTERGNFDYYTTNHIYRFFLFLIIFLSLAFVNIQLLYKSAYVFYLIVLILLIVVNLFGVTASGSTRWINLFL